MNFTLQLEITAYTPDQLVLDGVNQIALAGRSNVGKSSLINALHGNGKIAKTSSTPGKTRSINYYRVQPHNFFLVDLPGYGYAKASHGERQQWAELLESYFKECKVLRSLAILLDCRLSPQQNDLDMIAYARHLGLDILPVLTKADKTNQREQTQKCKEWASLLGKNPLLTSSSKKKGLEALCRQFIQSVGDENGQGDVIPPLL